MIQVLWDVDILSLGDEFQTFRRVKLRSLSRSIAPKYFWSWRRRQYDASKHRWL